MATHSMTADFPFRGSMSAEGRYKLTAVLGDARGQPGRYGPLLGAALVWVTMTGIRRRHWSHRLNCGRALKVRD